MSVSAQFLILYSVALAVVSTISTVFLVQTYALHRRAITWYGGRVASLNRRWRTLGGDPADAADELDDLYGRVDDPPSYPTEDDRTPQTRAPDIIIRDLVAALIPEQLTSMTGRPTVDDDAERPRAAAVVPAARNGHETDPPQDDQWENEGGRLPGVNDLDRVDEHESRMGLNTTVPHAPRWEPGLQPMATDGSRLLNTSDAAYWWNSSYRGRHEAELLIYPTAPFPLVVRNERDGGSTR